MKNWGEGGPPPQFIFSLGGGIMPPEAELATWVDQFKTVMESHGLSTKQWYFVFADEVSEVRLSSEELPLGEQMRKAAPYAQIFTNSSAILNDMSESIRFFKTVERREPDIDVALLNPYLLDYLRLGAKPITYYRCRGDWANRGGNMYAYYRIYAWHEIKEGIGGMGVWTYSADRGADPWKGPANRYSLVLRHPTQERALVHTRRYEVFREGIDDYRYVWKLRDVAQRKSPEALEAAEKLIQEAIQDITTNPSDTTRCEAWRHRIATQILSLR